MDHRETVACLQTRFGGGEHLDERGATSFTTGAKLITALPTRSKGALTTTSLNWAV